MKFSNKALDLIGNKQFSSSEIGQIVYNVAGSIDTDLETLEAQTNGSGFVGRHSPATTYQFCIQQLQLFNDVFKDDKPVDQLFKEMWVSVTSYQHKV